MNYNYNVERECFIREDNRGKPLYLNIAEAQRIISLLDLGYSVIEIQGKVGVVNPKASATTIKSFVTNYKDGNINIPSDAPAPSILFDEVNDDARLTELERRVSELEKMIVDKSCNCGKVESRWKKWLSR